MYQPMLLLATRLERCQHLGKAARQLADLVASVDVDPRRKILSVSNIGSNLTQGSQRFRGSPGKPPSDSGSQERHHNRDDDKSLYEITENLFSLFGRTSDLHGSPTLGTLRDHSVGLTIKSDVFELLHRWCRPIRPRGRYVKSAVGNRKCAPCRRSDITRAVQRLHDRVRVERERCRALLILVPIPAAVVRLFPSTVRDIARSSLEEIIGSTR
jgi:hypothetical protein